MPKKGKTVEPVTLTSEAEEYVINYYITINFMENCGVEKVVINQTGKPVQDPPPPPPGT